MVPVAVWNSCSPTFNLRSYPSVVRQLMTVTTIKTGPCFWIFWFFFPEDLAISEAVEIRNQKMSDEEVGCMHGDVVCMVMLCATVCRNLISFPAYLQSSALVEGGYNRGIHDARVTLVSPCLRQEFVQFLKSGALVWSDLALQSTMTMISANLVKSRLFWHSHSRKEARFVLRLFRQRCNNRLVYWKCSTKPRDLVTTTMQSLKTPERLLELSKRLSKVADDFEVIDTYMWTYKAKKERQRHARSWALRYNVLAQGFLHMSWLCILSS